MSNAVSSNALGELQRRLGYSFDNADLLQRALTHKSYGSSNNERLEFLGDAVLGFVIGHELYRRYPDWREDSLSLVRASLVRGATLAEIGTQLGLSQWLLMGTGERKSGGRERDSILADSVEAILGAVLLDGGETACREVILRVFAERLEGVNPDVLKDAKTRLQEYLQARQLRLPTYEIIDTSGADHARRYTVRCSVEDMEVTGSATASSRRAAEKAAAEIVLDKLLAGAAQ